MRSTIVLLVFFLLILLPVTYWEFTRPDYARVLVRSRTQIHPLRKK